MASRFQFALPDPRPRDGWTRVGKLDLTTTALLVIAGAASMFLYAISRSTFNRLVFHPYLVRDGDLWRLVTWPIGNPPTSIWVVLTLVFFWFFGHIVEDMLGRTRFLVLILAITIVPAVLVTVVGSFRDSTTPAVGLSLLGSVMLVLFAIEHPNTPFFFGIPAVVIAGIFVGIDVLRLLGDRLWGTLIQLLAAIVLGVVLVRQWGFAHRLAFIPSLAGDGSRRSRRPRRSSRSERSVIEGPWGAAPTPPASSANDAAAAQAELDTLLDKISASGLDSLTSAEKRRLNELSKRLR